MLKDGRGGLDQEDGTNNAPQQPDDSEEDEEATILVCKFFSIGTNAGNLSGPEGDGVGRISWYSWYACENKGWKGKKTAPSRHRIERSCHNGGKKEQ